ncbi:MAG: F0F1 ATP synthase subunit delta [Spirochaetaceae bacterium]|jgi:F-type H+-transporting ATPase subunit delta|nr:F0F1 ATP synthase subunit delta [Spirochaetaceae bacterium]
MFVAKQWAGAFINALEGDGVSGDVEEGLAALRVFAAWVKKIPGAVTGRASSLQLDRIIRSAIAGAGPHFAGRGTEFAVRLIVLLTRKSCLCRVDAVAEAAELILDRKRGILNAVMECSLPPEEDLRESLKKGIRRRTGAADVKLEVRVKPELLGGYRLLLGGDCIDASLRAQLLSMTRELSTGPVDKVSFGGS